MVKHFYVKFGDSRCIVYFSFCAEKQTHRQLEVKVYPETDFSMGKYFMLKESVKMGTM